MKKNKISMMTILSLLLIFSLVAGCGGGGSSGGGSVNPTDSPSPSPTSTTGNLTVNGVVRDENGFPIQGATVTLESSSANGQQTSKKRSSSDGMGEFSISQVASGTYNLQVSKDGRYNIIIQNYIINNTSFPSLSITQPTGSGTLELNAPGDISVTATVSGDDVNLSWSQSSASGFEGYMINRSTSQGVTFLDDNVGKFTAVGTTSMTDKNLSSGTYYYKVFQIVDIQGYQMIFASNEANVTMGNLEYNYWAGLIGEYSEQNGFSLSYCVVPASIEMGNMQQGMNITATSPALQQATSLTYNSTDWPKIKHFYYGRPAIYYGEITDYMSSATYGGYQLFRSNLSGNDLLGQHNISVEGETIEIANLDGYEIIVINGTLQNNLDGTISVKWYVLKDGIIVTKSELLNLEAHFIVQVLTNDGDSTYRAQKMWSNFDQRYVNMRDFENLLNLFDNLPIPDIQEDGLCSVTIPAGIFSSGESVTAQVILLPNTDMYNFEDAEISGYKKGFLYMWRWSNSFSIQ